jgi:RND family efflux transporter MFP subunit
MYFRLFLASLFAISLSACNNGHDHENEIGHEELKVNYTAYSDSFELYAEADPFVAGTASEILAHFTSLSDFRPLESASVTLKLSVNGQTVADTAGIPVRSGIYRFNVSPAVAGAGTMEFMIRTGKEGFKIAVPGITVFHDSVEAEKDIEGKAVSVANTMVFTKEQSWKIGFSTGYPSREPFGRVIKTTAFVMPAQGDEAVVTAGSGGNISFTGKTILEGTEVTAGQLLLSVKGSGFAEDNSSVRFAEAQNNYEQAKADYERAGLLAADKIISEKQYLEVKTRFENTKSVFESLQRNFSRAGQAVISPMTGFVRQVFVENGQYVEAGQPLMVITQGNSLLLRAEVPQRYAGALNSLATATLRSPDDGKTYTLEELGGKVLSVGKAVTTGSHLLEVNLGIKNSGGFVPGSYLDVWLKTVEGEETLTVPEASVIEEQGAFFVFVQVTPERFEKREIKTGAGDGVRIAVTGGLRDDERIVTKGAILVKLAQATGSLDAHSGHVH